MCNKKKYDYLIVGAGLFGAVIARELTKSGKSCLVVEKRNHIAGNIYTQEQWGIDVHKYGAHIFHTDFKEVWDYVNQFADFVPYIHTPIAKYKDEIYNLPFNMNTFTKLWEDVKTPQDAKNKINEEIKNDYVDTPWNLQQQAINLVGKTIFNKLIKGYTEKQWGKKCQDLPAFIIKRLPVRFTFDNNYYFDRYSGIPKGGYTKFVQNLLNGIEVRLNCDFLNHKEELKDIASTIIYTGTIDRYFDYCLGALEYRSLKFEEECFEGDFQGVSVVNYTSDDVPYTRIIEHKYFGRDNNSKMTVITKEYSKIWEKGDEPYYPLNNDKNNSLYEEYIKLAEKEKNIIFGGRLGCYRYFDMDDTIIAALQLSKKLINK